MYGVEERGVVADILSVRYLLPTMDGALHTIHLKLHQHPSFFVIQPQLSSPRHYEGLHMCIANGGLNLHGCHEQDVGSAVCEVVHVCAID